MTIVVIVLVIFTIIGINREPDTVIKTAYALRFISILVLLYAISTVMLYRSLK